MKYRIILILILLIYPVFNAFTFAQLIDESGHRVIIKLKNDVVLENSNHIQIGHHDIDVISKYYNITAIKRIDLSIKNNLFVFLLQFPAEIDVNRLLDEYNQLDDIDYVELDYQSIGGGIQGFNPNDSYFDRQWGLKNQGNFSLSPAVLGADIEMENAWDITQGSENVVVAIIDSGVNLNHPELAGRIWQNNQEVAGNNFDDDNNGLVDDVFGWDFVSEDNNPTDDLGHGTNIAGIVGANGNNSLGYTGIDMYCKLMILKVLNENNIAYYSWQSSAIYYAVDNGANVINISIGGTSISNLMEDAVQYAINNNVVVVACMMNTNSYDTYYPAAYDGVIAVGSTDPNDVRSEPFFWDQNSGSNFGDHISVVAPGNYIYGLSYESNTNYNTYWGGTSQAAPAVAAVSSLLLSVDPSLTPSEIKSILENSAEDQVGAASEDIQGWDQYYGHGRLNAYNALQMIVVANEELETQEEELIIFPNPSTSNFTIVYPPQTTKVTIFNTLGQIILDKEINNKFDDEITINNQGTYIIQLKVRDKFIYKKIIIFKRR